MHRQEKNHSTESLILPESRAPPQTSLFDWVPFSW